MLVPPAVVAGLNEPQSLEPQITDHLTPALLESFATEALSVAVARTAIDEGEEIVTIAGRFAIVRVTEDVCDGSLVTFAVIVTFVPTGMREGATYVAGTPLAV